MSPLIEVEGLEKTYPIRSGVLQRLRSELQALDGVDLEIDRGECLALVGESGSGKTTLGRCLLRLIEPSSGRVSFDGEDLLQLPGTELRRRRRRFQMIFQDPYGSLNPKMTVGRILAEPLEVHGLASRQERPRKVAELLEMVGLPPAAGSRYPHEFSGGQRQRIGIARALATGPEFLVADEPLSALDVSVQAQIINLLVDLQKRFQLALLLIAHDLAIVRQIAQQVAVLYLGRVVEKAAAGELFAQPQHPYTVSLLSAVPEPVPGRGGERIVLAGEQPSALKPPSGCRFHPRCPIARPRCADEEPVLRADPSGHQVACHYPGEMEQRSGGG
jgi:oligopeptide transport system ATP-binding protein